MNNRGLFVRWVRATWVGWLLGVPIVIGFALIAEAASLGGAQTMVGAGMGTGVGLMQGRCMRAVIRRAAPWVWSCAVGLAVPFLLADISKAARWDLPYSLYASVALGGLIAGVWQALLLRPRLRRAGWWVAASALGWMLAGGSAAVADYLPRSQLIRGLWGAAAFLGVVAAGGLALGAVTGLCLAWMFRQEHMA